MKNLMLFFSCLMVGTAVVSCTLHSTNGSISEKKKIIFDTDMGPDYDDVGAIAILHALADSSECEILATLSCNGHPSVAPTIETFNRYFNRSDIPIGIPENPIVNTIPSNHWNDSVIAKFQPDLKGKLDYPVAAKLYREVLSSQPDNSVTIVTVGFATNLYELLRTEGDEYSPLSGKELVDKKVKKWVAMAGAFPEGKEFNVMMDPKASVYTFSHWPTPILFSGFEIGNSILTGKRVAEMDSSHNPVAWAYKYNLTTYAETPAENRMSWDLTAVLCAIRDPERYFYVCGPGKFIVDDDGYNHWDADTDAGHYFLVHKYPYGKIADILEELMMHEPIKRFTR
jgi:inosine-uridine nucleoside N-ribohydrolase